MNLDRRQILLVNIVLICAGAALLLWAINISQPHVKILLEAMGTGLIATGGVNFIDKLFTEKEREDSKLIAQQRLDVDQLFYASKYRAKKVDIFGVSITEALNEFVTDSREEIFDRIFSHRLRLRLIFVHPDAEFLVQRAGEDHISADELRNRQLNSVKLAIQFYKKLFTEYNVRSKKIGKLSQMGSVEILLMKACPYVSVYRVDNKIYWGVYGSHKSGNESPLFLSVKREEGGMFDFMKEHYYTHVNNKEKFDDLHLVKMILRDKEPYLNIPLVHHLLGKDKVDEILVGSQP
ncbi:MAG: hypothetical protein HY867_13335 [Chloroflexi bacterium]|nr:hypothetical protein [Chloroflexota bacterium]